MKFLNNKEEVIDVELTQYGKHLLSLGKFRPEYYAFFDTDVLYDGAYAGLNEAQNDVHDRVKEVPQLEAQYLFHGSETEIGKINKAIRAHEVEVGAKKIQPTPEKHYSLTAPLGTISLDATAAPAWQLKFLKGEITGAVNFKTGDHPTLKIPQLNLDDVEYRTITKQRPIENTPVERTDLGLLVSEFKDGSYIDIIEDSIVIDVKELNSIYGNDNFEIEVFAVEEEGVADNTKENLVPLYFSSRKPELVKNGLLLDDQQVDTEVLALDTASVEYFFEILTDEEIDDDSQEIIVGDNLDPILGEAADPLVRRRLYTSSVREEDLKDC